LLLWKTVCARALDLTQNRKKPLGWLEHGYAYLRVNKKTRLQAIMDKARFLLHALPRESNLADEGKVDMAISWNANRSVEIRPPKHIDLNQFVRNKDMIGLHNIHLLSGRLRAGVRPTEQKQADAKDATLIRGEGTGLTSRFYRVAKTFYKQNRSK